MLSIQSVCKEYSTKKILDNITFEVAQGDIFGLLGPNGAGKTTLIRIINQIIYPDSGKIYFNDKPIKQNDVAKMGYLPEERGLYKKMKASDLAIYLAKLKGLSSKDAFNEAKYWFEKFEIQTWWDLKVEELSKGMQQKLQFIVTVIHKPEFVILDEPFSGFDPLNAAMIKNEVLELNRKGTTFMLSTHRMETVEELCKNIVMLYNSKPVLNGSISDIRKQNRTNEYTITYTGNMPELPYGCQIISFKEDDEMKSSTISLTDNITTNSILAYLINHIEIHSLHEKTPTFNDIFIKTIKDTIHE